MSHLNSQTRLPTERPDLSDWSNDDLVKMVSEESVSPLSASEYKGPLNELHQQGRVWKESECHGLGTLDHLSKEIIDMIIDNLNLRDTMNFSLSCHEANHTVKRASPLDFIKRWAPAMPEILQMTKTEGKWSIGQLKAALRRSKCVSCGETCGHLFLPTLERICIGCARYNRAYHCYPLDDIMEIFALDINDFDNIDPIHDPRGDDGAVFAWLVPIKSALSTALDLYGSRQGIKNAAEGFLDTYDNAAGPDDEEDMSMEDIIRATSLEPPTPTQLRKPLIVEPSDIDENFLFFIMEAKVVPRGEHELEIFWCGACRAILELSLDSLTTHQLELMGLSPEIDEIEFDVVMYRRAFCARSRREMCRHILGDCIASWYLINQMQNQN
ncbi:hypothetical protein N7457_005837 [Penicillium paradoxum]|uniref:uncharacterized protein n=1 Tax=Penicillium paradoxum TaxID=176176 RepID=UPI0025475CB7|nr:uncharacterized protein N7457_005837 [Penicillium paradoxum]KAJ5780677.1 hypothetical protein N7457_005837 [Penicillium paradoxum]